MGDAVTMFPPTVAIFRIDEEATRFIMPSMLGMISRITEDRRNSSMVVVLPT